MPTMDELDRRRTPRVAPSAPLELMWVMHFVESGHEHEGEFASLEPLRQRFGPELTALRADGVAQYSTELVVLAHRSGTLLDLDMKRFFARIDSAVEDRSDLPTLLSERPAERKLVRDRLDRLRSDRELRRRYTGLLSRIWETVGPEWMGQGRQRVVEEAQRWGRAMEDEGAGYKEVLGLARLWPGRPELDELADAAAGEGDLVLTPCWFGGKIHMIELDGVVYVGRGVRHGEPSYRKVAAEVSANVKALADPTRLAILLRLARRPASVTEVARQFKLAQPTVSAHVQVLREAGLLEEKPVGRSAELSASEEGLRRLLAKTEDSLVRLYRPERSSRRTPDSPD
jgi:DNA-binding transcriptional ArsR family regulator